MTKCRGMSHIWLMLCLSLPEYIRVRQHQCLIHLYILFSSEEHSHKLITILVRKTFKMVLENLKGSFNVMNLDPGSKHELDRYNLC